MGFSPVSFRTPVIGNSTARGVSAGGDFGAHRAVGRSSAGLGPAGRGHLSALVAFGLVVGGAVGLAVGSPTLDQANAAAQSASKPTASSSTYSNNHGPVNLGTARGFSVLGATMVTNIGSTTMPGDLGVNPGTSVTGFESSPHGIGGAMYIADALASKAQDDVVTAYGNAAGLTPTTTGVGDLSGLTLTPGIYNDGELSLTGSLTLHGAAESIWVFQSSSTLITGSASRIEVTGGASACNVFWQVGSSATLGAGSDFVGTILAYQSISAGTGSSVEGRLLARAGAVNLDHTTITAALDCNDSSDDDSSDDDSTEDDTSTTPESVLTPGHPATAIAGTPYFANISTAVGGGGSPGTPTDGTPTEGTPTSSYEVITGVLPPGLTLDTQTGHLTGTPTTPGNFDFTIGVTNSPGSGSADSGGPDVTHDFSLTIQGSSTPPDHTPQGSTTPGPTVPVSAAIGDGAIQVPAGSAPPEMLAYTGAETVAPSATALALMLVGAALFVWRRRVSPHRKPAHRALL